VTRKQAGVTRKQAPGGGPGSRLGWVLPGDACTRVLFPRQSPRFYSGTVPKLQAGKGGAGKEPAVGGGTAGRQQL